MIKKLIYSLPLFLTLMLTGCAQEEWIWDGQDVDRDYVEISFAIPEPQVVETRAFGSASFESDLANGLVYICKTNGDVLQTSEKFSGTGSVTVKIKYNDAVKGELAEGRQVNIVAVANPDGALSTISNISELNDITTSKEVTNSAMTGMMMSGKVENLTKAALNSVVTVELVRSAAKADVTVDTGVPYTLSEYQMWNGAASGYLTAGMTGICENIATSSTLAPKGIKAEAPSFSAVYGYPQKLPSGVKHNDNVGADNRAFIVVGGKYKGETSFYRIDLRKKGDDNKYQYLFLEPNHEYKIKITKVNAKGYATAAEAARYPMGEDIEVDIHDHVPNVMSMTSDGARELGVNLVVNHNNNDTDDGRYLTMKLFSYISDAEYPVLNNLTYSNGNKKVTWGDDFSIEVTSGSWLTLGNITLSSTDNLETGEGSFYVDSKNTNGNVYHVALNYDTTVKQTGELEGKLRVTWKGLSRDVKVVWKRTFKPPIYLMPNSRSPIMEIVPEKPVLR